MSGESVQQGCSSSWRAARWRYRWARTARTPWCLGHSEYEKHPVHLRRRVPGSGNVIKQRLTKQSSMGFGGELKDKYDKDPDILSKVTVEDLRAFGMIPEFLGRLPIVCTLQGLTKEMLIRILKEPKNAILKQYHKLLALDEVDLEFDDGALEAIADKAMKKDTGARALRAIIEDLCWISCMRFRRTTTSAE